MVRERDLQESKIPLVLTMYGQICGHVCLMQQRKAKQRWSVEKPKLDNARSLRGIYFIEPNDEEFKLIIKAARRKLEVPMTVAMPCKNTNKKQWGDPPQYWKTQDKIRLYC